MNEGKIQDIATLRRLNEELNNGFLAYPMVWSTSNAASTILRQRQNIFKFAFCAYMVINSPPLGLGIATITDATGGEFAIQIDTTVNTFQTIPLDYLVTGNQINFVSNIVGVVFSIGYCWIQAKGPQ